MRYSTFFDQDNLFETWLDSFQKDYLDRRMYSVSITNNLIYKNYDTTLASVVIYSTYYLSSPSPQADSTKHRACLHPPPYPTPPLAKLIKSISSEVHHPFITNSSSTSSSSHRSLAVTCGRIQYIVYVSTTIHKSRSAHSTVSTNTCFLC